MTAPGKLLIEVVGPRVSANRPASAVSGTALCLLLLQNSTLDVKEAAHGRTQLRGKT